MNEDTKTFPLEITPLAMKHAKKVMARKPKEGQFLRVGVKGGGCSGLEYVLKTDTVHRDDDLTTEVEGITVVCDAKSAEFLRGATLDYSGNLISGGFQFKNPNAGRTCGCGTSFTPKRTAP
jgi:iron-sulfur cluster assembly protein